ncbi:uncharacterized protein LOC129376833 [Poeciliopsis prolifica]|uniref:uncharacterized protein LOC129376833 n=1 Tax=Poeciliopsis prolifica TaxID=188132 RepID=UPI00241404BA|nr:uncharacterized protein LOC129376833 [Poeciliopsis prolifica]
MDPGPEKHQQGDQLEALSVALPADGSPTSQEHQDDGKEVGKVWSNVDKSDNMVSGDHGEESRCSSPQQSVDYTNSSSGSSSQDDCSSSSSDSCFSRSSGSSTTSYSGSSAPISSEEEVGNEYTSSYGSISTTSCSPTVDRPYAELEMAQKLQEGISQLTSLESSHGFEKREEPTLSPDDSRLIGTSSHHQVGLVGDVTCVPSVTGLNRKRTKDSDSEEEPPAKKTRDTVAEEELSFKRTRDSEDAEEEPPAKRCRDSEDAEEEPPAKKLRESGYAEEEPPAKTPYESQPRDGLPSKRTRDNGAEEEIPAKRSRNSDDEEESFLRSTTIR